MKETNNHHANRHLLLLRFLVVLSTFHAVAAECDAGYTGGWDNLPSLISLIDARDAANVDITPTDTVGIPALSGTSGMTWTKSAGTLSFTTVDGIPCWDMNAGSLVTSTRTTLGDSYTLFYYWKPRESDTAPSSYRSLRKGWDQNAGAERDHWVMVGTDNKNQGMFSISADSYTHLTQPTKRIV